MTRPDRSIAFSATIPVLAALFLLTPAATSSPAFAAGGVPPFCVARGGGGEGGSGPQDCRYFDYQSCVQAASARGNCVQNIDYHGEVSTTATPAPARHRR
jgi:hypothetical protein